MPKFKTEKFHFSDRNERECSDVLEFSGDIQINAQGKFYTNLSREVVEKFQAAGINVGSRSKKFENGYFEADTFDGLKNLINELGSDYVTKENVSHVLKIEYSVETICAYALEDGEVFPNGYYVQNKSEGNYWREGTVPRWTNNTMLYGFNIYAKPFCEVVYKYRSNKTFSKKLFHPGETDGMGDNGKWLANIIQQKAASNGTIREIEYTEEIAGFFRRIFEFLLGLMSKSKTASRRKTFDN